MLATTEGAWRAMDHADATSHGIVGLGRHYVRDRVLAAWEEFIDLAGQVDLQRQTRVAGRRAHDVCVPLGRWEDYDSLGAVLASTRDPERAERPDTTALHAAVVSAHRDSSRDALLAALRSNRDAVVDYFDSHPPAGDLAPGMVEMGTLPFLTIVHGQTFELATAALDLVSAGGATPSESLLDTALAAVVDVTGALGARMDLHATVSLLAETGGWTLTIDGSGWAVTATTSEDRRHPHVRGRSDVLVDAAAGRANPVPLVARGAIRLHRLAGLLAVAPVAHEVPGLPGGGSLSLAVRTISSAGGAARWFRRH